jgi:hypothetical protein
MKISFFRVIPAALLLFTASCKSKSQKDAQDYMDKIEKTVKENSPDTDEQKSNRQLVPLPEDMKNLVGEWELVKFIPDHNGDHKIDPDEDKDALTVMKDYLKLNADGTCEYTIAKMEGTYEIITKDDGKKKIIMYDRVGGETTSGRYIFSVTDKELIINRIALGGSQFEVFKRL